MKILLDGYIDHNLGDDLMLMLAANKLEEHELYTVSDKLNIENVIRTDKRSGFDCYLKVIGSGFFFHNKSGMPYRMREIWQECRYAKKRAVIGCSVSRFGSRAEEMLMKFHLSRYGLVTVRDEYSQIFMKKLKNKVCCKKYSDMVFSIPDDMIPDVQSEGLLGISVHKSVSPHKLAKIADSYINKTGKGVLLLCFNAGRENDEGSAQAVFSEAKNKSEITIVKYTTIGDMLGNMKRCECILGIRLHSIVLAARMGIPFVPVQYDYKTKSVLEDIEYNEKIFDTSLKSDEALERILKAQPYTLSKDVTESAKRHILSFKEYLKS